MKNQTPAPDNSPQEATRTPFDLYLDIDGVLNAWGAIIERSKAWPDYQLTKTKREVYSPSMVAALNAFIAEHSPRVFWVTTWEDTAPAWGESIGLVGAGDWPWLDSIYGLTRHWAKHESVVATSALPNGGVRPAIWLDDDLTDEHDAALWAAKAGILAIAPNGHHGITPAHLAQMQAYARQHTGKLYTRAQLEEVAAGVVCRDAQGREWVANISQARNGSRLFMNGRGFLTADNIAGTPELLPLVPVR